MTDWQAVFDIAETILEDATVADAETYVRFDGILAAFFTAFAEHGVPPDSAAEYVPEFLKRWTPDCGWHADDH